MARTIYESEHQGIPVSRVDVPGAFTGTLSFGVGHRHEPPHLAGITHLAEHLVFRAMGEIVPRHDGTTTENHVEFYADGQPGEVADFLNRVARVIRAADFTAADLDLERRVIEAERPGGTQPERGLLTARYGLESVGKADAGNPTLWSIELEEVREWVRRWFVVENAQLSFTGPVPAELRVELDPGRPAEIGPTSPVVQTPVLFGSHKSGVALSLVVEPGMAYLTSEVLVEELTATLRVRHGLIYSVSTVMTYVDAQRCVIEFVLDPIDEITQTARLALQTVREAGRAGPSAHAVAAARAVCRSSYSFPSAWAHHQDERVVLGRLGIVAPDPDAAVALVDGVESEALRGAIARAWDTLVVMVDKYEADVTALADEFGLPVANEEIGVVDKDARRRGWGRLWLGAFGSVWRDWCRLDGSILWWAEDGSTRRVDLDDVVVAGRFSDGALGLIDRRGCSEVLYPAMWIGGSRLVAAIIKRLPQQVVRDFSWHGERPTRTGLGHFDTAS